MFADKVCRRGRRAAAAARRAARWRCVGARRTAHADVSIAGMHTFLFQVNLVFTLLFRHNKLRANLVQSARLQSQYQLILLSMELMVNVLHISTTISYKYIDLGIS